MQRKSLPKKLAGSLLSAIGYQRMQVLPMSIFHSQWVVWVIYFSLLFPVFPYAQFTNVLTYGGNGNENGQHLLTGDNGGFFVAGTFDDEFAPVDKPLPSYGEEDFFIGQLDANGNWVWINSGGSFLNDKIEVMRQMPNGDLLLTGTFWLELTYGENTLTASDNIKGIFIIRLNAQGEWQWGRVIDGADLKSVSDVQVTSSGNFYLTGHFSEALAYGSVRLEASGKNDAYLFELNPEGDLQDWKQAGFKGTTRGQTIALHPEGGLYWGGVYDDTLRIDTFELYANTFDRDVFLTRFDATGKTLWARRAGGVFEEELSAMATDAAGNLLATGFLIGVMSLSDNISIQSRNGNPDIFIFKYDPTGQAQWARAFGGERIDLPTSLSLLNESLVIGGTYQDQMAWGDQTTPLTGGTNGFIAGFRQTNGTGIWLGAVATETTAFVESSSWNASQQLFILGSYNGDAQLGQTKISTSGQYDFYLAQIDQGITPNKRLHPSDNLKIFPNPTRDWLHISGLNGPADQIRVYDLNGKLVKLLTKSEIGHSIRLGNLNPGAYWVEIQEGGLFRRVKVMLVR